MKYISSCRITEAVRDAALEANRHLPDCVMRELLCAYEREDGLARHVVGDIIQNARMAAEDDLPMCQDCGMAVVYVSIGHNVHITGDVLGVAVDRGISEAYVSGYLRKSTVSDPIYERKNRQDNTPAVLHVDFIPGDSVRVVVAPKGAGSENMSRLAMLKPADGESGVFGFVVETVRALGANSCPPLVVGVGVGGNLETCALTAKKALLRETGTHNSDPRYANLEKRLLDAVNATGIGPAGYGGKTTALAVNVEYIPTHLACLPVAVNLSCHALRHAERVLEAE